jgi:hypothetical protein
MFRLLKEKVLSRENQHGRESVMKRNIQIITSASAGSLMAFTTLVQETPFAKTGGTEITQERSIQ